MSARTGEWDLFVRTHLDIMHDAVARIAFSTAAYDDWNYGIRDLERVGIDVVELSIGMALAAESLGDPSLDDVNRMRLFGMYLEYTYGLADSSARRARFDRLRKNLARYPIYLHEKIRGLNQETE